MLKIKQDLHLAGPLEGIALNRNALAGRQFYANPMILQRHRVIARACLLGCLVETAAEVRGGAAPFGPGRRLEQDIAQLTNTSAANMGVGKTHN